MRQAGAMRRVLVSVLITGLLGIPYAGPVGADPVRQSAVVAAAAPPALHGLPYWPGWDIARAIAITPDGTRAFVLDGFGGVHVAGTAPRYKLGYWPGWDIARAFTYSPTGHGAYMLDAFGAVHTGGDAVGRRTGYWPGWDIARDLVIAPDNAGYTVVDGFGGMHRAGSAPRPGANWAFWGYDHAGGIAIVRGGYVVAS